METNATPPRPDPTGAAPAAPGDSYDPAAALADVDSARRSVADRLVTPWWYHPVLGALVAVVVLTGALDLPTLPRIALLWGAVVAMGLLVGVYQRLTGLWVDARNLGPVSRRWWIAYAVTVVVLVGLSLVPLLSGRALPMWAALLAAAVAVVATVVIGRRMDETLRREIRSGAVPVPAPARSR